MAGNCEWSWSASTQLWTFVDSFCTNGDVCSGPPATHGDFDLEVRQVPCVAPSAVVPATMVGVRGSSPLQLIDPSGSSDPATQVKVMPDLTQFSTEQRQSGLTVAFKNITDSTHGWTLSANTSVVGSTIEHPNTGEPSQTVIVSGPRRTITYEWSETRLSWVARPEFKPTHRIQLPAAYYDLNAVAWDLLPSGFYSLTGTGSQFSNTPLSWVVNPATTYIVISDIIKSASPQMWHQTMELADIDDSDPASDSLFYRRTGSTFLLAIAGDWVAYWRDFDVLRYQSLSAWVWNIEGQGASNPFLREPNYNITAVTRHAQGLYRFTITQTTFFGIDITTRVFPSTPGYDIKSSVISDAFLLRYRFGQGLANQFDIEVFALTLGQGNKFEAIPYDIVAGDIVSSHAVVYMGDSTLPPP